MKVDIWMPIFIGDYLRDTQELDGPEHGAYFLLLMHYWQKGGKIGNDVSRLARVAKSNEETTRFILENYFELSDGNYRNERADREMEKADDRREKATSNGKKGGRPPKEPAGSPDETGGLSTETGGFSENNRPVSVEKPGGEPERNPEKSSSPSPSHIVLSSDKTSDPPPAEAPPLSLISEDIPPEGSELYSQVKEIFESVQPQKRFTSYPKEGKAIKHLIAKARARDPDNPDIFLLGMIQKFQELQETKKFYRDQPFLPSRLNSAGIWDGVLRAAELNYQETRIASDYNAEEIKF